MQKFHNRNLSHCLFNHHTEDSTDTIGAMFYWSPGHLLQMVSNILFTIYWAFVNKESGLVLRKLCAKSYNREASDDALKAN